MRARFTLFGLMALLACFLVDPPLRATEPAQLKKITTIEGITEYQLNNGLQILLFPDPSQPKVTINLTVLVGSRHEGYGEAGMAHLLEHMLFKGTPTHKGSIWKLLEARGARMNGTTNVDRTNYFETMAASDSNLEFAIKLEADRLVNSYVKREDLVSEMTVVRNEFEAGENSPTGILVQRMSSVAYQWHSYGRSVIGNRADIENVPIEKLQAFYKKYYQPDNCVLVVAGKFDEANALKYIGKYFGAIPRPKRTLEKTYTVEPAQDGERLVTLRRVGGVGLVGAMYHIPAGTHPEFPAVEVLSHILTSQPSGRLYEALVKGKKAAAVFSLPFARHDPGLLLIGATMADKGQLEEVRDSMLELVEKIAVKGVSDEEVERARRSLLVDRATLATQTTDFAIDLSGWAAQGDWRLYFLHRDRLEKVTAANVKSVADKYLKRSNRTVGMYIPSDKPERVAVPAAPDIKELVANYKGRDAIAMGEVFDGSPANVEKRTTRTSLPDGLKVALLPKKTKGEKVQLRLSLDYGNAENLKEVRTASSILPYLMLRGTKNLTQQQLTDELNKNKAGISVYGDAGVITFSVVTERKNMAATLELLRQVLREPALRADDLEVIRQMIVSYGQSQRKDPAALASTSLTRRLAPYPKSDIRCHMTMDEFTEATKTVTLEQIKRVYQDYLGAEHGELVIVGDFDADASLKTMSQMLAGWKAKQPYAPIVSSADVDIKPGKEVIETPDKENANFNAGLVFPMSEAHPDYAALVMANDILGVGAASRLWVRLRDKEGLCYDVGSSLSAGLKYERAAFTLHAICNPANMAKAEKSIKEEVERLWKDGVTKEELDRHVTSLLQQLAASRANDNVLLGRLGTTLICDCTMARFSDFEEKVKALTPEMVNAAFRKHIDPSKLAIVVAGDFAKVAAGSSSPSTGNSRSRPNAAASDGAESNRVSTPPRKR